VERRPVLGQHVRVGRVEVVGQRFVGVHVLR
jgi:hypothetical protein